MRDAEVAGRLEAECRRRAGQRQVVVDGLGHVSDADGAAGPCVDLAARVSGVVAADRDQLVDVEALQDLEDVAHVGFGLGRVGPRSAEDRAAAQVDALDVVDGQRRT